MFVAGPGVLVGGPGVFVGLEVGEGPGVFVALGGRGVFVGNCTWLADPLIEQVRPIPSNPKTRSAENVPQNGLGPLPKSASHHAL